jgi:hypothetical protein
MNLYSVDSNEAMKRGNEAFNGSSLQFLRSIKRFIPSIFYSALNASSPLILKKNHRLTLYRR